MIPYLTFTACAYECIALASGKVSKRELPTITQMTRGNNWLAPVIVTSLTVHFIQARQGKVTR